MLLAVQNALWACLLATAVLYGTQKTKYELRRRILVVLFDGTGEDRLYTHRPPTNIGRFADLVRQRRNPATIIMYHRGVATSEEHGLPFARIPGLIGGKGITQIVRDMYLSLVDNYRPGDSLYLLGYSRGSAAAWELACLLDEFGVPRNPTLARKLARDAFKKLRKKDRGKRRNTTVTDRMQVTVDFLGLFDCVVATGALIHINRLPPNVKAAYHAVGIDERRRHFAATLLPPGTLEVWFSGGHGNIGGGSGCTLSDITLQWMIEMAGRHGLYAAPLVANLKAAEREIQQEWDYILVRLAGEMRPRFIPKGAIIHPSVIRLISNTTYRPPNLPTHFRVLHTDTRLGLNRRKCLPCRRVSVAPDRPDYKVICGDPFPLVIPPIGTNRPVPLAQPNATQRPPPPPLLNTAANLPKQESPSTPNTTRAK